MDATEFDNLSRSLIARGSRRWALTAVLAGIAAVSSEAGVTSGKKKKHKRRPAPQTCPATRPVPCGEGCCTSAFPKCCPSASNPAGTVCVPVDAICCPLAEGGAVCAAGLHCCPPVDIFPMGYCCFNGSGCCDGVTTLCPVGQTCTNGCCV